MDKKDKDIEEWLDWLEAPEEESDQPDEASLPADDEALQTLRQMVQGCNEVFARKQYTAPDTEQAWAAFQAQHTGKFRRIRQTFLLWGGWAGMAACLVALAWILFTPKADKPQSVMMFTAINEEQGVTLSADDGAVWKLDDQQAGEALGQQGIRANAHAADYREVEQTEMQVLNVPRGKDYHLVLSDGTEVWINAESHLFYPSRFTAAERTVRLEGEAYFKVAPDEEHPFIVQTDRLQTHVLGTEFNLKSYAGETSYVTLVTGHVTVQTGQSETAFDMLPGQELALEVDGTSSIQNVETYARTQWKEGFFYFDCSSLEEILYGLGRWYNVDIELDCAPSLLNYHLHYVADRHGTLSEALERLNGLERITVTIEGNRIVLK